MKTTQGKAKFFTIEVDHEGRTFTSRRSPTSTAGASPPRAFNQTLLAIQNEIGSRIKTGRF